MNINKVAIEIRNRPALEAIDLGFFIGLQWFWRLALLWLVTAVPVFLVSTAIFFRQPLFALLVFWWLKPVYENIPLYWLSRAVFGEKIPVQQLIKESLDIMKPYMFSRLTLRRFSPNRSFFLPVMLLEKVRGTAYKKRTRVLTPYLSGGIVLTGACLAFELIFFLSIIVLIAFMLPGIDYYYILFISDGLLHTLFVTGLSCIYLLSAAAIAPLFISSGFSLYISLRTRLEAWDIELRFKRILKRRKRTYKSAVSAVFLFIGITVSAQTALHADVLDRTESRDTIKKILADDDFGTTKSKEVWKLKNPLAARETENNTLDFPEDISNILSAITLHAGVIVKTLLWLMGITVIVLFIYYILRNPGYINALYVVQSRRPPGKIFNLDIDSQSLPDNISSRALELVEGNELRSALSLLYRGALHAYVHRDLIQIPESSTEKECVHIVCTNRDINEQTYFSTLTDTWVQTAYGHILPETSRLRELCTMWNNFYGTDHAHR